MYAFLAAVALLGSLYKPAPAHWVGDGFRVVSYFPGQKLTPDETSPFVLLDYNEPHTFPAKWQGVGYHPHRGFETVTIVYSGEVMHRDTAGNSGTIGPGDVQWMTAGSGLLHQEKHRGGRLHAVQLWVNLPNHERLCPPKYQSLTGEGMGRVSLDDRGGSLRVIAGNFRGIKGPAETHTPMEVYDAKLSTGTRVEFDFPAEYNTLILVMKGAVSIGDATVQEKDLYQMKGAAALKALEESFILVLSGKPLNEPYVQSGPFVLETEADIKKAYLDFRYSQ